MLNVRCAAAVGLLALASCDSGTCIDAGVSVPFAVVDAATGAQVCPYQGTVYDEEDEQVEVFESDLIDGKCRELFFIPGKVSSMAPGTYVFEVRSDGYKPRRLAIDLDSLENCEGLSLGALEGEKPSDKTITFKLEPN